MWKLFVFDNKNYILKFESSSDKINFYLYDFKNIWNEELLNVDFTSKVKNFNPLIVISEDEEYMNLFYTLWNSTKIVWEINEIDSASVHLTMSACLEELNDMLFKCRIDFKLNETEMFCREIFIPTLISLSVIEEQQKEMCDLLVKKDAEIQEYKLTLGSEISRGYKKTIPFDKNSIIGNENTLSCRFSEDNKDFSATLLRNFEIDVTAYKRSANVEVEKILKKRAFKGKKRFCVGLNYTSQNKPSENLTVAKEDIKAEPESQNC